MMMTYGFLLITLGTIEFALIYMGATEAPILMGMLATVSVIVGLMTFRTGMEELYGDDDDF